MASSRFNLFLKVVYLCLSTVILAGAPARAFSPMTATINSMDIILSGTTNLYSATTEEGSDPTAPRLMWLGGWRDQTDLSYTGNGINAPDDRLYVGMFDGFTLNEGDPGTLQPVHFINGGPGGSAPTEAGEGHLYGFLVNDPTVIDTAAGFIMFFTLLGNQYTPVVRNDNNRSNMQHNVVGMATSEDEANWTFQGTVIGQNNGYDNTGAWSPSALFMDSEIWVYYNTGIGQCTTDPTCNAPKIPPRIFRTRLEPDGKTLVGTQDVTLADIGKDPQYLSDQTKQDVYDPCGSLNVDVASANGQYWMVANDPSLTEIHLCLSQDGLKFAPYNGTDGILVNGNGSHFVLTPHIEVTGPTTFNLFFSQGDDPTDLSAIHYTNKWTVTLSSAGAGGGSAQVSRSASMTPTVSSCVAPSSTQSYLTTSLVFFSQAQQTPSLAPQAAQCSSAVTPVVQALNAQSWPCGTEVDQATQYVQGCVSRIEQDVADLAKRH